MFQMGGFGPMPGQVHHFLGLERRGPPLRSCALSGETRRLYAVMDGASRTEYFSADNFDGRFRHPRLGLAASAPQGRPHRISARPALGRRHDGPARRPARLRGDAASNALVRIVNVVGRRRESLARSGLSAEPDGSRDPDNAAKVWSRGVLATACVSASFLATGAQERSQATSVCTSPSSSIHEEQFVSIGGIEQWMVLTRIATRPILSSLSYAALAWAVKGVAAG